MTHPSAPNIITDDRSATKSWPDLIEDYTKNVLDRPVLKNGWYVPGTKSGSSFITLQRAQGDLAKNTNTMSYQSFVHGNLTEPVPHPFSFGSDVIHYQPSPTGEKYLLLRTMNTNTLNHKTRTTPTTYQQIEIWTAQGRAQVISLEKVGQILLDAWFQSTIEWSRDEILLCFVAEPVQTSHLGSQSDFDWTPHLGEKYTHVTSPNIYVCHVPSRRTCTLDTGHLSLAWGQLSLSTRQMTGVYNLVSVGWPMASGMYYCLNRPSKLYSTCFSINDNAELFLHRVTTKCITPTLTRARSPRWSPDGSQIVFLSSVSASAHNSGSQCWQVKIGEHMDSPELLVDIVPRPETLGDFPGIYALTLPTQPWIDDDQLVLTTEWGCQLTIIKISTVTRCVTRLQPPSSSSSDDKRHPKMPSYQLLDLDKTRQRLLVCVSSPFSRPRAIQMSLCDGSILDEEKEECPWMLEDLDMREIVQLDILSSRFSFSSPSSASSSLVFQHILLSPKDITNLQELPLHVQIHGGPHTCATTTFSADTHWLLTRLPPMVVLDVNYVGSTGHGEDHVKAIQGHIGQRDVDHVWQVIQEVIKGHPSSNISLAGGSHGGFIVSHLLARYPHVFKCAILRNPVVDTLTGFVTTDIPDWYLGEVNPGNQKQDTNHEEPLDMSRLVACSPFQSVANIQTPVLLGLGALDQRVHPLTSRRWVADLKQRQVPLHVLMYPKDGHALDSVQAKTDFQCQTLRWLRKYLFE